MGTELEHVSLEALQELKDIMEDEFSLLVETFISDSIIRIENISTALENADAENLRTAAHSFKGSSSNIYAIALTDMCKELEAMGLEGQIDGAPMVFEKVKEEFGTVKSVLENIIAS